MKKILLILSLSVFAISCNDDFSVTAKPLASVVPLTITSTKVTACTYDFNIATGEGVSKVYYVVLPTTDQAPTSSEIWTEEYEVVLEDGTSESGDVIKNIFKVDVASGASMVATASNLTPGLAYTLYAVTVNADGVRSDEVFTSAISVPGYTYENVSGDFDGAASFTGAPSVGDDADFTAFTPVVTKVSNTEYTFSTFWGPIFVAEYTGNPAYNNNFLYSGTLTINPDLTVTIVGNSPQSWDNLGGTGSYDPCTKTITYNLKNTLLPLSGGVRPSVDVVVTLQ